MAGEVQFPQQGYVRLAQLIGRRQVTEEEARRNRRRGKGPRRARAASPGILPARRSTIWDWVKRGRIPAPVYPFGKKIPCWSADTIRQLIEPQQ